MTLNDLRKLAEAATPGPYVVIEMGNEDEGDITRAINTFATSIGHEVALMTTGDFPDAQEAKNAAYIAALSPERILAMIECIRAADDLRQSPASYVGRGYDERQVSHADLQEYDAARAKLDEVMK